MLATKRRRRVAIGLGIVVAATVATFTLTPLSKLVNDPADGAAVRTSEVVVEDREFGPAAIEVDAGTPVTWRFQDEDGGEFVAHNVVFDGFRSPDTTDGVYEHSFDEPGTYHYRCDLHFLMNGRVDVVADAASRPPGSSPSRVAWPLLGAGPWRTPLAWFRTDV